MRPSDAIQILSRRQPRNPCEKRTSLYSAQQRGLEGPPTQVISPLLVGASPRAGLPQEPRKKRSRYKYVLVLFIYFHLFVDWMLSQ